MSGGSLSDYKEYNLTLIRDNIIEVIEKNKVERTYHEKWDYDNEGKLYEWAKYIYDFSEKTIEEFKKAVEYLNLAYIYAHRIDWLLSGDDGEEAFHERLKEDLEKINKCVKTNIQHGEGDNREE